MEETPKIDIEDEENLIFLCVDESEEALNAFQWFREHCYRKEHVIGLVHVHSLPCSYADESYANQAHERLEYSSAVIQKYFDICSKEGIKVKIFSPPKVESIGHTICELVKEEKPISVVMGQRGLGAVKRTLYGSVSDFVLHHAHIPVMVVPPLKVKRGDCLRFMMEGVDLNNC